VGKFFQKLGNLSSAYKIGNSVSTSGLAVKQSNTIFDFLKKNENIIITYKFF
jgi:hypothetical protein